MPKKKGELAKLFPSGHEGDRYYLKLLQKDPILFVEKMWGLTPQPVKDKFFDDVSSYLHLQQYDQIKPHMFEPFEKGKHITWQQYITLSALKAGKNNRGPKRISVASGHGIGKTAMLSWILIWFMFAHYNAQAACTAPSAQQMNDVLWKEVMKWIQKMPPPIASLYEWSQSHIRMREARETWFARAATARRENPEALAGVHGDAVLLLIDEASAVPDTIFTVSEGALTEETSFMVMTSNPTRRFGYFFDSHHEDKGNWAALQFSSLESPTVDVSFVNRIVDKYGPDSDEFRVRVEGAFPKEDTIDDEGYMPLINEGFLHWTDPERDEGFSGPVRLGVDPAGEGINFTVWVLRDNFKAKVINREEISDAKGIAHKTLSLMDSYMIDGYNVYIDNFGVGADVVQEIALAGRGENKRKVRGVNVGDPANDTEMFKNLRGENYWNMRQWLMQGGLMEPDEDLKKQLTHLRFRRNDSNKIQIMPKKKMRKLGFHSPDAADALMLTFTGGLAIGSRTKARTYQPKFKGYKRIHT